MFIWCKRVKYFKALFSLGFFTNRVLKSELIGYNNYLSLRYKNNEIYTFQVLAFGLHYIVPLVSSVFYLKNCFLFIDLKKTNLFFLNKLFNFFNFTYSFIIYDWAYGIITNFFSIELLKYTYRSINLPTLVFLLELLDQQRMISIELSKKKLLSIGLVSIEDPIYVDYPIFIKSLSEYNIFFLQLILKLINSNSYD